MSICVPAWVEEVKLGYFQDPEAQRLVRAVESAQVLPRFFSITDGLIRYKGRVWLGNNYVMHRQILQNFHSGAIGGHSGFRATYHRIRKMFAWPGMKADIKSFVASCSLCK